MYFVVPRQLRTISANSHYDIVMSVCGSNWSFETNRSVYRSIPSIYKLFQNSVSWTVCLMQRLCLSLSVLKIVEKPVTLASSKNSNNLLPWLSNPFLRLHLTFLLCSISHRHPEWFRLLGRIEGFTQLWKYLWESAGGEYRVSFNFAVQNYFGEWI